MASPVVEVCQWWGDELLDVRVFGEEHRAITLGTRTALRWRFLGVDMGLVPAGLAPFLGAIAPGWSEIRRERRADFAAPDLEDDWDLVVRRGDDVVICVPPGWSGPDGETIGERPLEIRGGTFRFTVARASAERLVHRFRIDAGGLVVGASVIGILFIFAVGATLAPPARAVARLPDPARIVETVLRVPPRPQPPSAPAGTRAKGREGKRSDSARPKQPPIARVERDEDVALGAGIASVDLDALLGGPGLSSELRSGASTLIGFAAVGPGGNGLGSRGSDLGGGGTADGLGGFGPRGRGPGAGGPGGPGIHKAEGSIAPSSEGLVTIGALDRAQVDEVVKRHLNAIKYCYQRELQRQPALGGKVTVKFTISADGTVSSARAGGTLDNDAVRSCVAARFLAMHFPKPRGGGIVIVSYPFLFAPQ